MSFVAKILIFLSTFVSMSKDLMWGAWLDRQDTILGSPLIPKLLNKYIPPLAIILFVLSFLYDFFSSTQSNRKLVASIRQKFLDRLHKDIFPSSAPNIDDFNRITFFTVKSKLILFRRDGVEFKFYKPWCNYLVITSRTGKFQTSLTSFKIDGDKQVKNNGIAGLSWLKPAEIITLSKLNPGKIEDYCRKTNMDVSDFNNLNQKSSFYTAFCVRDNYENKIGVIVFDTINLHKIEQEELYSIAKSLSTINEG